MKTNEIQPQNLGTLRLASLSLRSEAKAKRQDVKRPSKLWTMIKKSIQKSESRIDPQP